MDFSISAVCTGIKNRWGDKGIRRSGDEGIEPYQEDIRRRG